MLIAYATMAQAQLTATDAGSNVHFVIKNFGINTSGDIKGLKAVIKFDKSKPANSSFDGTVDVGTLNTDNGMRDGHLKKEDYFNAEKYPQIHIKSSKIEASSAANIFVFTGTLTIKSVTKPIRFNFTATPKASGYYFEGNFSINRLDYGVGGNSATMSDKVKLKLTVLAK